MGLKIITDGKPVTVVRQDKTSSAGNAYTQYSLMVSSKNKDNTWVSGFIEAQFKKGVDIANKAKINITNAFYTVNEYNGKKYTKIFVLEYDVAEAGEAPKTEEFVNVDLGAIQDLPFA